MGTELTVTSDHRIAVPDAVLKCSERQAADLSVGDKVICGGRVQRLSKVLQFEERVEVVELCFVPDESVETFMAPSHGILTKGHCMPLQSAPGGPFAIERLLSDAEFSRCQRRAQSSER